MKTGRPKKDEKDKKQKVTFTIDDDVYNIWQKYCEKNNIKNQSKAIEKIIIKNDDNSK